MRRCGVETKIDMEINTSFPRKRLTKPLKISNLGCPDDRIFTGFEYVFFYQMEIDLRDVEICFG